MSSYANLSGLLGVSIAMTAALQWLPYIGRLSMLNRAKLFGLVFVFINIPFGIMPIASYVRGATGDLSMTTLVLLCSALFRPWWQCVAIPEKQRLALSALVVMMGVALYPMALGIGMFDPYQLGYGSFAMVGTLLLIAVAAGLLKQTVIVLCISVAALAWSIGWYESDNLWDYLIDPFLVIYALFWLGIHYIKRQIARLLNSGVGNVGSPTGD